MKPTHLTSSHRPLMHRLRHAYNLLLKPRAIEDASQTRAFMGVAVMLTLAGCVSTQTQADGSTKVRLSMGSLIKPDHGGDAATNSPPKNAPTASEPAPRASSNPPIAAPNIRTTAMSGLFSKHPYDGTPKTYFPRVAVTVTDWYRNDCWTATATVWWSKSKSESVSPFSVCWGQSVGYAVNNAANLHLFMQQMAVEHSGNVRTTGPKPPMLAVPDRQPISERQQLAFQGFVQQLILDTGWQPGAPTNLWLVGYDASAAKAAAIRSTSTDLPMAMAMDSKAKTQLEQALACAAMGKTFDLAESALRQAGWQPDQGITSVTLQSSLKVYGLNTSKVAISRDSGQQTYRSFLSGFSLPQVAKAASLKLGKDGKTYGRVTKLGVLAAGAENGETTLTCTVDTEGVEG